MMARSRRGGDAAPKCPYATEIIKSLVRQGLPTVEPRLIEAFMRLQYGTLDHLDRATFDAEVALAAACVDADPSGAEELARSYGL